MGYHNHKCEACGVVWKHDVSKFGMNDHDAAHECPGCGKSEYWKYFGDEKPTFENNGTLVSLLPKTRPQRPAMYGGRG